MGKQREGSFSRARHSAFLRGRPLIPLGPDSEVKEQKKAVGTVWSPTASKILNGYVWADLSCASGTVAPRARAEAVRMRVIFSANCFIGCRSFPYYFFEVACW